MGRKSKLKKDPAHKAEMAERRKRNLLMGDLVRAERERQTALGYELGPKACFTRVKRGETEKRNPVIEDLEERERIKSMLPELPEGFVGCIW